MEVGRTGGLIRGQVVCLHKTKLNNLLSRDRCADVPVGTNVSRRMADGTVPCCNKSENFTSGLRPMSHCDNVAAVNGRVALAVRDYAVTGCFAHRHFLTFQRHHVILLLL